MVSEGDLTKLVLQLEKATSLNEQLRILARSWRTVRALSQDQRKSLVTRIGLAEAETLLERLGRPNGLAPARLLRAIQQTEKAQPGELRRILGGFREPQQRSEALAGSLNLLGSAFGTPLQQESLPPQSEDEPLTSEPVETSAPPPAPTPESEALDTPHPTPKEAPEAPGERSESKAGGEFRVPQAEISPPEVVPRSPREGEQPVPEKIGEVAAQTVETEPPPSQQLVSENSLIQRFQLLRRQLRSNTRLDDPQKVLETFPQGWQRRRALCAMIRAGCFDNSEEFLPLVSTLANPADHLWCVSHFLHYHPQPSGELGALLTQLDPRVRRRLAKRFSVPPAE